MLSLDIEIYSDRYELELKYAAECQEWLEEQERETRYVPLPQTLLNPPVLEA